MEANQLLSIQENLNKAKGIAHLMKCTLDPWLSRGNVDEEVIELIIALREGVKEVITHIEAAEPDRMN